MKDQVARRYQMVLEEVQASGLAGITKEKLTVMAADVGMPLSEYVRMVLDGHAHGSGHVERLAVERVRRVLGNVT